MASTKKKQMPSIQENQMRKVMKKVFKIESIETRQQLDNWCGGSSREKLYKYVKAFAPNHWNSIQNPKACVRFYSQKMVTGYLNSSKR
jgi:hypothetical protein